MGDIDINVKNFIKINTVFAQLFSQGVYGGEVEIDPDKLQEFDTVSQDVISLENGNLKSLERLRDGEKVAMLFDQKVALQVIMGIEGQTGVHYYMPVRCMELDALTYSYQCKKISEKAKENKELKTYADGVPKGTKILPTVTLVFYTGSKPWDGPKRVYDMLDIPEDRKEWMKHTTPDYRMNLIDARHMTDEEIDRFDGDLKAFLLMLKERFDRKKLKSVVARHRETWYAISKVKNDKRYAEYIDRVSDEEMAGGIHMDATLDYMIAEGEVRGEARGEIRGAEKVNRLGILLSQSGRTNDFLKSLSDKGLQKKLFVEFGLEDGK
ncbi:Rpn family recombination-promoting nuclease/putative transposase [Candidatus Ventrimonas sp. KK005]|nr:hypothetical protein [Lachnospiraceae bacterium]NBH16740.1 hypothetical protein [Clostridiaceae bacterium]